MFEERVQSINPNAQVIGFAQEINPQSYAICKSDTILKGGNAANVRFGDTLANDRMPDKALADTENIPLKQDVDAYMKREVKKHSGVLGDMGAVE